MSLDALKIELLKLRKLQRLELMAFLLEQIAEEEKREEETLTLTDEKQRGVVPHKRVFGRAQGKYQMAADFDEPLDDFKEYME